MLFLGFVLWKFDVGFFGGKSKLQEMSFPDEEWSALLWQDKVYKSYGIPDSGLIGGVFGKIENEKYVHVHLCNGQRPEEWLIIVQSGVMGWHALYKEESVTEIPEGFEAWD